MMVREAGDRGAAESHGASHWATAWSLDFSQKGNSGSGELWFASLKDHCGWSV